MIKHLCTRSFMLMILLSFGWEMIAQEQPPDEPDDAEAVVPVFDLTGADLAEPPEPIDIPAAIPLVGLTSTAPVGLQVVLHEAFLAGGTTDWMQGTDWQIGFTQVGHAAQTRSNTPALLIPTPLDNVAIETRFELGFGRMQLHLRQSDWGRYTAEYDAGGELRLYRNEQLLGQVAAPATTEWSAQTLRFTALGDQLGLSVDGVQMLQLVDPDPLPAGTVVIGGVFPGDDDRSVLRFDTLTVWAEAGVSLTPLTLSEPEALTQMPGLTGRLDNHIVSAVWLGARREEIYVRTLTTPNTRLGRLLVGRRGSLEGYPRLSPGGDKLAFISSIGGDNNSYTNLYVVDLTAENLQPLPIPTGKWRAIAPITTRGHSTGGPAWSPDGNQIAFHSNRAGQGWKIWVVNADGTGLRRLTAHGNLISEHDPSWSPDGTRIVFAATGCGSRSDLYVTSVRTPQGGACGVLNQQRIVSSSGDDTRPRWSPDGRFIAYTAYQGGQPDVHIQAMNRRYIYQVGRRNYGPSGNLNLTINAPGGSRNLDPAWSPDGRRVVFASTADANTRLHVLTLQVQGQRIRLQNPGWVRDPISPAVSAPYGGADWSLPAARAIAPPAINNVIEVHEALEEEDARLGIGVEPGPTDGTCTLNEAILAANSLASSTPPALPQGQTDCRPRESNGQLGIYLALISGNTYVVSEALPAITGRVTIRGLDRGADQNPDADAVQIARSANAGTGQFRVFTVAAGGHLTLDQVRVSHGDVDGDGGGIHNAGTLILQNGSIVTGNTASGSGGGIYNSGTLTVQNNAAVENNRTAINGGGIYNAGTLHMTNSRIQRNVAVGLVPQNSQGGGIYSTQDASVTITNSCIVFNTAREAGGVYATTPSNTHVAGNWWGDDRGPSDRSRPDIVNGRQLFIGKGDVVTSGVIYPSNGWITGTPPSEVSGCIDYSDLFFNSPDGTIGQPGLAGEVYIRARQILGRELAFEEIFAFTAQDAGLGGSVIVTDEEKIRLVEAIARVYYNQTQRTITTRDCDSFSSGLVVQMREDEAIAPSIRNPNANTLIGGIGTVRYMLCGLGTTEWYGEDDWAEDQAYEFVDFVNNPASSALIMQYGYLATAEANDRTNPLIKSDCRDWENGERDRCPFTWGNLSIFPSQAITRMAHSDNTISPDNTTLTSSTHVYRRGQDGRPFYASASDGAERGLTFRFAINGQNRASFSTMQNDDFFLMLSWQREPLYCGGNERLWIAGSGNSYWPLCEANSLDPTIVCDIPANNNKPC